MPVDTYVLEYPPRELSPNATSRSWAVTAQWKKKYRSNCSSLAWAVRTDRESKGQSVAPSQRACWVRIDVWHPGGRGHRPWDSDNVLAWMKSGIDGLCDAGVFVDDRQLLFLPSRQYVDKENPRVEVTVWCGEPHEQLEAVIAELRREYG